MSLPPLAWLLIVGVAIWLGSIIVLAVLDTLRNWRWYRGIVRAEDARRRLNGGGQ